MTDGVENLSNLPYERCALGVALRHHDAAVKLTASLVRNDFFATDHQVVFDCIRQRIADDQHVDLALIADDLRRLPPGAGSPNLTSLPYALWDEPGSEAALPDYVEGIHAASKARRLVALGDRLRQAALETDGTKGAVEDALMQADSAILEMAEEVTDTEWRSIVDVAREVEDGKSRLDPIFSTGLTDLDAKLNGGLREAQMVVIAGRPASGKSTLALDIARNASFRHADTPGLHISLEMNSDEIGSRLIAAEAGVPLASIVSNTLSEDDRLVIDSRLSQLEGMGAPLYVADQVEPTLPAILAMIHTAHRRLGIKYVTVDYLQLITSDGEGTSDRQQTVANVSRKLKGIARSLGIVVFAVSQLNRGSENRTDKRPQVSDLRESGQIEQDADLIIMVHRPELYDPNTERGGEADLIVGKHRGGPTGTVVTNFQGHFSRFVSAANGDEYSQDSQGF